MNDNNFVNLHDVTNLGLYNKLIFVTQKQVLAFYIIAIECKALNSIMVPHTAFPKCVTTATKSTTNTATRVHFTKAVIGTCHKIGGEVLDIRFLSNHTRKQTKVMKEKERATGLAQTPATHMDLLSRKGSLQVPLQNTQSPNSHISPIFGPLFTEDRLSTSS